MATFLTNFFKRYQARRLQDPEVTRAVQLVKSVIDKQRYRRLLFRHSTYVSFNGGKDATVVLFLTMLAYNEYEKCYRRSSIPINEIKTLFFVEPQQPFEEIDEFMGQTHKLIGYKELVAGSDIKQALHELKQHHEIDSVIMGTRRTDPNCQHLSEVSPSDVDKGYPKFDRINPIIDWSFSQIWTFIRNYEIPVCKLYEQGYTYLGNKSNTIKNPTLKQENKYRPAWEASEETELLSRK